MQLLKLIRLYFYVCEVYDRELAFHVQRFTKNRLPPQFTDAELITAYLFATAYEGRTLVKQIYDLLDRHYRSWFPDLPSYQAFNARLNRLNPVFPLLIADLVPRWQELALGAQELEFLLTDSMPIITCSGKRYGRVAPELTDKGYNSTKSMHFWGVKLHVVSVFHKGSLLAVEFVAVSGASEHVLSAQRELLSSNGNRLAFADKAFVDSKLAADFAQQGGKLYVPVKNKRGQCAIYRQ